MSLTKTLFSLITNIIAQGGYSGLLLLTFVDSTVIPLPNETFMPFAGYLISTGRFTFVGVLVMSIIGAVLGSLTSYAIGYYGADPFVKKFGRYLRISEADLKKTHDFFAKYGDRVILVSRFIPVVRQFSSIPAGAAKMNIKKFVVYTAVGSTLWNSGILFLGYVVGVNSERFESYTSMLDKAIVALVLVLIAVFIYKKKRKK